MATHLKIDVRGVGGKYCEITLTTDSIRVDLGLYEKVALVKFLQEMEEVVDEISTIIEKLPD